MDVIRESSGVGYTAALARGLASLLRGGDVVLLSGELGAGKTTLIRGLSEALGVARGVVSSPTFVMLNVYPVEGAGTGSGMTSIASVAHLDAYRLRGPEDLDALGWDRVYDEASGEAREGHVVLVEWPERVGWLVAGSEERTARVRIEQTGADVRRFVIGVPSSWRARAEWELFAERAPIRCRITGEWVSPTAASYPFASERARGADLHRWFSGSYGVSRPATPEELEDR
jgi:tRNA threonylcarbamoyl adenosine modification protein YjeE